MSPLRTLHRHVGSLLKLRNYLHSSQSTQSFKSLSLPFISSRTRTSCFKIENRTRPDERKNKVKGSSGYSERGVTRLKLKSRGDGSFTRKNNPGRIFAVRADRNECAVTRDVRMREDAMVRKDLSPDMEMFVRHLYSEGYFNHSSFLPDNELVLSNFEYRYGRDFIKFAAERFGRDNQEIAKWLSGSDLKNIAVFGCPSTSRKNVFAAKTLRKFFRIQEDTVCHKCILRQSCKYVNQSVWNGGTKHLNLTVVMKVITQYALEAVPRQLIVPEEIMASVSRLLKEILNLSRTVSR